MLPDPRPKWVPREELVEKNIRWSFLLPLGVLPLHVVNPFLKSGAMPTGDSSSSKNRSIALRICWLVKALCVVREALEKTDDYSKRDCPNEAHFVLCACDFS